MIALKNFPRNLELGFSFISIGETWLRDLDHHADIPDFNRRSDLNFAHDECAESLFLEVIRPTVKNIVDDRNKRDGEF